VKTDVELVTYCKRGKVLIMFSSILLPFVFIFMSIYELKTVSRCQKIACRGAKFNWYGNCVLVFI